MAGKLDDNFTWSARLPTLAQKKFVTRMLTRDRLRYLAFLFFYSFLLSCFIVNGSQFTGVVAFLMMVTTIFNARKVVLLQYLILIGTLSCSFFFISL